LVLTNQNWRFLGFKLLTKASTYLPKTGIN
jgi:hypothetical protein